MMKFRVTALAVALAGIWSAGCGDSAQPVAAPPTVLNGTWRQLGEVPGSSEIWTLTVSGAAITGIGTWTAEACCGGTTAITGSVDDNGVHLDITPVSQVGGLPGGHPPSHFDAALVAPTLMQGAFAGAAGHLVQFQRQ
jgi:hypothetical protein